MFDTLLIDAFFWCGYLQSNCPIWDQLGLYVSPRSPLPAPHNPAAPLLTCGVTATVFQPVLVPHS